jgi:hypothetical protein
MKRFSRRGMAALSLVICWVLPATTAANGCNEEVAVHEGGVDAIKDFIAERQAEVLTFEGYSGSRYQHPDAMLQHASRILDGKDPARTLINIGATAIGIGAVYEIAKRKGFTTMGIVSTLARQENAALSPCVDHVFFVEDETWGGLLPGTGQLSPTSQAIVDNSTSLVAIGGGDVARDELLAARRAGKPVDFIPADMNHEIARAKARKKGRPEPDDFRGSAHVALSE